MIERVLRLLEHRLSVRVLGVAIVVVLGGGLASLGPVGKSGPPRARDDLALRDVADGSSPAPGEIASQPGASTPLSPQAVATLPGVGGTGGGIVFRGVKPTTPASRIPDFGLRTQGIANTYVKVGFSYNMADCGDAGVLNASYANAGGDPKKAIQTYAKYINDNGGINGLEYRPVIEDDGGSGCPEKNVAAAVQMLEQDKVFLAVPGLHVESDYLIQRHLPVFGGRDDPASLAKYGANGLMLIEPQEPTFEAWATFGKYYLDTPHHVPCVIRIESGPAGDFDTAERLLVKKMAKYGMKFKDIMVFKDDVSTAQQQADDIVGRAKGEECDQVWFMAGNPIGLIFFTDAATQHQWFPTWTFTSATALADSDLAGHLMDQVQWNNAVGLSYRVPAGEHPMEGNCKTIYEQYNGNDGMSDSAAAQIACAQILTTAQMMRRAIRATGILNANTLMLGASEIKDDYFYDATVPMSYTVTNPAGPFKTRGFSDYTVVHWNTAQSKYLFPAYPCYYTVFEPNSGGCRDLRKYFKRT